MIAPVLPVYRRSPYTIARGEGVYLFDTDGRRYLDFAAGIAVNSLGHCHPHAVAALKKQAETVWHTSNLYQQPGQILLASRLVERTFADTVFFTNSGAEAVECGIKMIRKYHHAKGQPERNRIVTFQGAFHGRTLATIAAGGNPKYTEGFDPAMPGFDHLPFNDEDALRAAIGPETAAILLEPVQGEGGIRPFTDDFLRLTRKLADQHGLLLFLDEVQCGMGRTGTFFDHERAGIVPDIVAVAKGIGSGFPLGACLATEKAASGMTPGSHGSTYGGNPLATAVGNAVLDVILAPGFLQQVAQRGAHLHDALQGVAARYPALLEGVRGRGLLLGLVTRVSNTEMVERLRANGMMTVAAGDNVIRVMPPLILEEAHIREGVAILEKTCNEWQPA